MDDCFGANDGESDSVTSEAAEEGSNARRTTRRRSSSVEWSSERSDEADDPSSATARYGLILDVVHVPDHDNGIPGEQYDFALIEVKPEFHHAVRAKVVGHPGLPRSGIYPPGAVLLGDRLDLSGHGVGFSTTQQTRESRFGFYWRDFQTEWQAVAPIMPGDSGGPVLHEDGRAFRVVTHLGNWGAGGPYLHQALAQVQDLGWSIQLRTAS